tara:strand:+ start:76 stop:858 length:783 start_codon:yes stop_codon:yes gene_type:complete
VILVTAIAVRPVQNSAFNVMPTVVNAVYLIMKGALIVMQKNSKKRMKNYRKPIPQQQSRLPQFRFSPTAWAKLLYLRDYGETEVGGFGITPQDDLLLVQDLQIVEQTCSLAHVAFVDDAVANFFDDQVDAGLHPEQFGRIWIHTHPGDCPLPSPTDEKTFDRVFGRSDWAVMFILARTGQTYARLKFNVGPTAEYEIPVKRDYSHAFAGCDPDQWEDEYLGHVHPQHNSRLIQSDFNRNADFDWEEDWLFAANELKGEQI